MKKKFAGLLAAMMVLMMGTTVFASQSPTSEATAEQKAQQLRDSVSTVETGDAGVGVQVGKVDANVVADANEKATSYSGDAEVLGMVELSTDKDISKGVTLTIYVAGVKSGDNVRILHKLANGTWEVIVPYVGNGFVRATFYSLSPIAIVKYPSTASVPSTQQVPNNAAGDAPSTNDANSSKDESSTSSAVNDSDTNASTNSTTADSAASDSKSDSKSDSSSKSGNSSSKSNASAKTNVNVNVNTSRTNSGSKSGAATSPKTGQEFPVIPCVAVAAFLVATIVYGRKKHSL